MAGFAVTTEAAGRLPVLTKQPALAFGLLRKLLACRIEKPHGDRRRDPRPSRTARRCLHRNRLRLDVWAHHVTRLSDDEVTP